MESVVDLETDDSMSAAASDSSDNISDDGSDGGPEDSHELFTL